MSNVIALPRRADPSQCWDEYSALAKVLAAYPSLADDADFNRALNNSHRRFAAAYRLPGNAQ